MKQIKTIIDLSASAFDKEVNEALRDGWQLVKRYSDKDGFIAELEREEILEEERCCDNCRYSGTPCDCEPCISCSESASNWEAK